MATKVIFPNEAERLFLKHSLGVGGIAPFQELRLFVNDIPILNGTVLGSFTEAAGGGYSAKAVNRSRWVFQIISQIARANQSGLEFSTTLQFDFTGPLNSNDTIFGWFLVAMFDDLVTASGVLAAKRLNTPFQPVNPGDKLNIGNMLLEIKQG